MKSWCRLLLVYVAQTILAPWRSALLRNPEGGGFPGQPQPVAISGAVKP